MSTRQQDFWCLQLFSSGWPRASNDLASIKYRADDGQNRRDTNREYIVSPRCEATLTLLVRAVVSIPADLNQYQRLDEAGRTKRRSVADAFEAVRANFSCEPSNAFFLISPPLLSNGDQAALVNLIFQEQRCIVSLPTASKFRARICSESSRCEFEISALQDAQASLEGAVTLSNGVQMRAVEVVPSHLPYKETELDQRILRRVIELTDSRRCLRSLREHLPKQLRRQVPNWRWVDYGRIRNISAPPLKTIQAYIQDKDPQLTVSNQKIANSLRMYGVRIPKPRPR